VNRGTSTTRYFEQGIAAVPECGLSCHTAARWQVEQGPLPRARQKLNTVIMIAPKSDGAVIAIQILAGVAGQP